MRAHKKSSPGAIRAQKSTHRGSVDESAGKNGIADWAGEETTMQDYLMDVKEVAEFLGLAPGTIYHLVSQKKIPCVRLSARCLKFRRDQIEAWIEEKSVATK